MVEISAAPVTYSDANQLRIWAWENRLGQMLILGCTSLGPQNFRQTRGDLACLILKHPQNHQLP